MVVFGAIAIVVLLSLLAAGAFWLDRLFEEPGAVLVPSLTEYLDAKSVMAVLAHPDDEILMVGPLVEAKVQPAATACTLTLTPGDAGLGPTPISQPQHLATIRTAEAYKFGYFLQLDDQVVLDYPDGKLAAVETDTLLREVVARVRQWQPDLIVSFDPESGITLHPDHKVVGAIARQACQAARDGAYAPELGPPHAVQWLARSLAPRPMLGRVGGETGQAVAAAQPDPDYAIRVAAAVKCRGWMLHASQHFTIRAIFGLPPRLLYTLWDKEHYAVEAVG